MNRECQNLHVVLLCTLLTMSKIHFLRFHLLPLATERVSFTSVSLSRSIGRTFADKTMFRKLQLSPQMFPSAQMACSHTSDDLLYRRPARWEIALFWTNTAVYFSILCTCLDVPAAIFVIIQADSYWRL